MAGKEMGESFANLDLDPAVIEHVLLYTTLSQLVKGSVKYSKARLKPATKFSLSRPPLFPAAHRRHARAPATPPPT